jgi:hypothetical protein
MHLMEKTQQDEDEPPAHHRLLAMNENKIK